ncbi:MAG: Rrf2 family transcriptional regulator [Clostridia bacterium]
MRITTKGRYALRVMADLSINARSSYVPLKEVAARQAITVKYLEQIIMLLSKEGLLKSARGTGGGYQLARLPEAYTVGEILRAAEGSLASVACLAEAENHCPRKAQCCTLPVWEGLDRVVNQYLDSITLAQVANDAGNIENCVL